MAGTITESDRARSCSSTCLIRVLQLWCFLAISPTITSASTRPSNPNTRISASLRHRRLGLHAPPVHPPPPPHLLAQVAPRLRVSGLMLADELLEQHVFLRGLLDQAGLDRAMHREVVPRRH